MACKYIQVLHLAGRNGTPFNGPILDPSSLIPVLAKLPSLKVLRIRAARLQSQAIGPSNNSPQPLYPRSTSSSVSLRCLDLHSVHVVDDDPFLPVLQLLLSFHSIHSLGTSLCGCWCPNWTLEQSLESLSQADLPTHLRIQSFFVESRHIPQAGTSDLFVETVRRSNPQTLNTFECVWCDRPAKLKLVQGLLDDAGSSIENLTLRFIEGSIPGLSRLHD